MTPKEKRTQYFKNNPEVFLFMQEIKNVNASKGYAFTESKEREIKKYAIEHTRFYRDFHVDDSFPVINKLEYLKHMDDFIS